VGLQWDTFVPGDDSEHLYYSSTLLSGAQLPSWISFNAETVTFEGTAPASVELETYAIVLFASPRYSFGDVQDRFNITVARHDLSLSSPPEPVHFADTVSLRIEPSSIVLLDSLPLSPADQPAVLEGEMRHCQ
jgi:axial budding pattern protein 2